MRVLLAPQEFKRSLTARQACEAMALGLRRAQALVDVDLLPLSDGGGGLVDALITAQGGEFRTAPALDPIGREIDATFGIIHDHGRTTAVVELAAASGLSLLRSDELDPLRASTFGTGQLLGAALDAGVRDFIIGIGGSATNDGGTGIAEALGARFLAADGYPVDRGGAGLLNLETIELSGLDRRLRDSHILVASDVRNPLYGPEGAAAVYGPQKGATAHDVDLLDAALKHLAGVIERALGRDVAGLPGAGAAGGAGAGLMAFLNAELRPGFALVADATHLKQRIEKSDLVLTGEGRLDSQTGYGKTVAGVSKLARELRVPAIALVGGFEVGSSTILTEGLTAAFSIVPGPISLEDALAHASKNLASTAEAVLRTVLAAQGHAAESPTCAE